MGLLALRAIAVVVTCFVGFVNSDQRQCLNPRSQLSDQTYHESAIRDFDGNYVGCINVTKACLDRNYVIEIYDTEYETTGD